MSPHPDQVASADVRWAAGPGTQTSPSPAIGALLVLAGAVLWGTTGTSQALGPDTTTPLAVGSTRLVAGGLLLVVWATVSARVGLCAIGAPTVGSRWEGRIVPGLVGAVAVAAYQLSFFAAVDRAGVALGTAVAIGSSPIVTGLLEWLTAGRRPARRWWVATALSAVGVAVLAGPSSVEPTGVLLALAAGTAYATYAVASKRLLDTGLPSPTAMAVVFGGGGALLLPALFVVDLGWLPTGRGVLMLAWLAAGTILLAYLLFGAGLRVVPAATAATLSLAEPLTAAVLGVVVLAERPTAAGVVGAIIILLGLAVLLTGRRRPPVPAPG